MWFESWHYLYPEEQAVAEYITLNKDPDGLPDVPATFACMGRYSCFAMYYKNKAYARIVPCP